MKKSAKLLSLLLSASLASQMISSVNINATKDSITFYDVKNNILDLKAYDAELDTNHDGNMNVFDVIRANKTLIQEESYTDLKEKVYMLETQIESLYQKLNEKTDAEEGKQLSSNDYTDEEKQKLEGLNNYDDSKINEKIDSLVQIAYDEKKGMESSIDNKVDKEEGKQLSSNDYTDEEKQKLESLNNYDDNNIKNEIKDINSKLNKINDNLNNETIISVGIGKDYTSLRQALNYANGIASKNNKVIIEFYGGGTVYNIQNEITDSDLNDSSFIGLIVKDFVKIKGMNGDFSQNVINLTLPTTIDVETRRRISTLNTYNGAELENLTIIGENTRYAVHDDYAQNANVERMIKNVYVKAINTVNSRAWGAGYRSGSTWNFENCIFENTNSSYSFSAHNTQGCTESAELNFRNCRFKTAPSDTIPNYDKGACFGTLSNNANGVINYINFYGCSIERIVMYEESASAYGTGILTRVQGYGNTINNSDVSIRVTDGKDYSSYKDLI